MPSSEITDESVFRNRREFIRQLSTVAGIGAIGSVLPACVSAEPARQAAPAAARPGQYDTDEPKTPEKDVTTYNNYYEFGTGKDEPALNAGKFKTSPWTVQVEGVKKPAKYALEDLLKGITMEDRVYRMRCVEAWSMVIPWYGFPLATLINRLEPLPSAKFVEFRSLYAPDQMPGQKNPLTGLSWPYIEGLRMDEAMNPLTLFAVGVYGHKGPNQNGAPLRLVTPWKYGFKGIKAITTIKFVDKMPNTSWPEAWKAAYGFYANVNPNVNHPSWSQATERRLGGSSAALLGNLLSGANPTRKTLMFNGYTDQVASMYTGMDLRVNY
ncbi:MAG TPA: protein-methionine-sulfoxide reductase catalytic subunit MsrP [Terriglobia bacterium]|nr:protein-methionine-sulfoxide reductase catalytic subunit MsrP [Terriglobia bacterium]